MISGGTISIIGLLTVLLTLFIIEEFILQITGFVVSGMIAVIGIILDLVGEILLERKYKLQKKTMQLDT